jgi:UDP-glucose 4-epimerase
MSPYGVSKLATEGYAVAYGHSYGMRTLAFRFFNVFGPGQRADHDYAAVIPRFLDATLNGKPVTVYGDGTQSRDFTYVDTVCAALYSSAVHKVSSPTPMNLAFGTNTTLLELIELIEQQLGHDVSIDFAAPRAGDIAASQADGSLLKSTFPELHPIDLADGLEQTIAWFRAALA